MTTQDSNESQTPEEKMREARDKFYAEADKGSPMPWRDIGPDELWNAAWQACAAQSAATIARLNDDITQRDTNAELLLSAHERMTAQLTAVKANTVEANTVEKWKGIALAQDGDGRTFQQIETPLLEVIAKLVSIINAMEKNSHRLVTETTNLRQLLAAAQSDNVRLREAGEAAMRLDYFREHNALARMMQEALARPR